MEVNNSIERGMRKKCYVGLISLKLMNHRSKPQKPRTGLPRSTSKRISCNSNKYSSCLLILYLCTSTALPRLQNFALTYIVSISSM
uniref:Uncharacterized protein n=1 Tax=Trichogramma kaykai TaxID=54128 RepID=A0ABD2WZN3_9HYME